MPRRRVAAKREILDDNIRARQAKQLVEWLGTRGCANIVVGGDFNTVSMSRAVRLMRRNYDDALWLTIYSRVTYNCHLNSANQLIKF